MGFFVLTFIHEGNKITPINFVDFILQHKEDSELKGSIKADTVSNLKLIDKVMESVINNKKYSANEIY